MNLLGKLETERDRMRKTQVRLNEVETKMKCKEMWQTL
jgi:hypothetical protein